MLNGDGVWNGKKKNNNNNNFARAEHFLLHFFAVIVSRLQRETF